MKTFELVSRVTVRGNVAELGFGDYAKTHWKREATVEAVDARSALSAFKKMFPSWPIRVSGRFPNYLVMEVKP